MPSLGSPSNLGFVCLVNIKNKKRSPPQPTVMSKANIVKKSHSGGGLLDSVYYYIINNSSSSIRDLHYGKYACVSLLSDKPYIEDAVTTDNNYNCITHTTVKVHIKSDDKGVFRIKTCEGG